MKNIQAVIKFFEHLIEESNEYPEDSSDVAMLRDDLQDDIADALLDLVEITHDATVNKDSESLRRLYDLTQSLFMENQGLYALYKVNSRFPFLDVYLYVGLCGDEPHEMDAFLSDYRDGLIVDIEEVRTELRSDEEV